MGAEYVVLNADGEPVASFNDRAVAERMVSEIDGSLLQRMAPLTDVFATFDTKNTNAESFHNYLPKVGKSWNI